MLKAYCKNCKGKKHYVKFTGEEYYLQNFFGDITGKFWFRTPPCRVCKVKTVFCTDRNTTYVPSDDEVLVFISKP